MIPELTNVLHGFRLAFICRPFVPLTDLSSLKAWISRHVDKHPSLKVLQNRLETVTDDAETISILAEFVPGPPPLIAFQALLGAMCKYPYTYEPFYQMIGSYVAVLEVLPQLREEYPETYFLKHYPYQKELQTYYQNIVDDIPTKPDLVDEAITRFQFFLIVFYDFEWDNFAEWNLHHSHVQQRMDYLRKKGQVQYYYMADPQDLWYNNEKGFYDLKPLELLVYPSTYEEFNPFGSISSEFFPPQEIKPSTSPFRAFWKKLFG